MVNYNNKNSRVLITLMCLNDKSNKTSFHNPKWRVFRKHVWHKIVLLGLEWSTKNQKALVFKLDIINLIKSKR